MSGPSGRRSAALVGYAGCSEGFPTVADLVSVIIPAYNAARYLGAAIDSVIAQTHDRVEIVVVDDASTDGTASVAAHYGTAVRYAEQTHRGQAAARNLGAGISTGRYLAFLDADDLWEPEKLAIQLAAFDAHPGLDVVFGRVVQFWSPEVAVQYGPSFPHESEPLRGDHPGTMLVPRAVFDEIGPFREDNVIGDFIDWYARALDDGRSMLMLEPVVMRRRLHGTNLGRMTNSGPEEYARVLRQVIDRRRGCAG
ncbi:MAG TPA: glycosyltransferase family A protein [Aeromicrobium sp.]|nr:glycosyltransferase family A protein [Aeromicrobium sp.]